MEKERSKRVSLSNCEKKRRIMISNNSTSCSSVKSEEEVGGPLVGTISSFRSPDANFDKDTLCQSSPSLETPSTAWLGGRPMITYETYRSCPAMSSSLSSGSSESGGFTAALSSEAFPGYDYAGGGGTVGTEEVSPPPYPFSLLGGGF